MYNRKFYVHKNDESKDYSITIHFDTQEEQDRFLHLCNELNLFKMELPGQQANDTHDIHN